MVDARALPVRDARHQEGWAVVLDLHPFIVHFPLALIILSALSDAVGILGRREQAIRMGYVLLLLGSLGAVAGALTGQAAEEIAENIPNIGEDLETHERLGTVLAWTAVALCLLRTHLVYRRRFKGVARVIYLLFALGAAGLASASGYTGARLVYQHGAGTRPVLDALEREARERNDKAPGKRHEREARTGTVDAP